MGYIWNHFCISILSFTFFSSVFFSPSILFPLSGLCALCVLIGLNSMHFQFFESFREGGILTRQNKGSEKLTGVFTLLSARYLRDPCNGPADASSEIILCLEPAIAEFITEQRSLEASWFNIKQLTEPRAERAELISIRQIYLKTAMGFS